MEIKMQTTLIDPVCGMGIPDTTAYRVTRNGELYGFCSEACRERFLIQPLRVPNDRGGQTIAGCADVAGFDFANGSGGWSLCE